MSDERIQQLEQELADLRRDLAIAASYIPTVIGGHSEHREALARIQDGYRQGRRIDRPVAA